MHSPIYLLGEILWMGKTQFGRFEEIRQVKIPAYLSPRLEGESFLGDMGINNRYYLNLRPTCTSN